MVSLAVGACDDRMIPAEAPTPSEATMPRTAMPVASTTVTEGPALSATGGGASATRGHHAIIVTSCAIDKSCSGAQATSPQTEATYRVAFGRGAGTIRTRGQATADLYKEIRDRMDSGAHLAAEPHHLGDPAPIADTEPARMRKSAGDDPVVEAAFQLMDAVDQNGEVAIDGVPMMGPSACKLSMGHVDADAGTSRCLVEGQSTGPKMEGRGRH
jgi:hypothetical protein